jgi:hypothetical protein
MAQIEVEHHPRKYGESKYGLARVYKVLIDLLALNTVLTAVRFPLFGFGIVSVLSAGLAGLSLLAGLVYLAVRPEETIVVLLGAGMLWGALSLSLLMLGGIASLVYSKGSLRVDDLLEVKTVQEIRGNDTDG